MERTIKSKPKLADLFNEWRNADNALNEAIRGMSVTPKLITDELNAYEKFQEALKKCNC